MAPATMQGGIDMRKRTFDALLIVAGLLLAAILAIAGGFLTWGHSFANSQVHNQLAAQKIVFPTANNPAIKALPPADAAAMKVYAGQTMTTGAQAETYADHFIAVHLKEAAGGLTYSQVSYLAMTHPKNATYAAQDETLFKGTALRSMLLNAYGFWKLGQIAWISAWVAFAGAILFLLLGLAGAIHLRLVPEGAEVFNKISHPANVKVPVA
jgi:hypothetical protein